MPSPPNGDGPSSSSPSGPIPIGGWNISPAFSASVIRAEQVLDALLDRDTRVLVRVQLSVAVEVAHAPAVDVECHRIARHSARDHTAHEPDAYTFPTAPAVTAR